MIDIIEIVVSLLLITFIGRYLTYVLSLIGLVLPPILYKFMLLVFAISVVQFIIARKDD